MHQNMRISICQSEKGNDVEKAIVHLLMQVLNTKKIHSMFTCMLLLLPYRSHCEDCLQ